MVNPGTVWERLNLLFIAGVLISLLACGCGIESPQAPSWDTTLRIPVVNRVYSSSELFDKLASDNIKTDSAGNSFLAIERDLDSLSVKEILEYAGISGTLDRQIGAIKVQNPSPQSVQVAFEDHVPLIAGVVPDTGMWLDMPFQPIGTFSSATIAQGGIVVQTANNTGFRLDLLVAELRNNDDGALVAEFTKPDGLNEGASCTDTIPLTGRLVSRDIDLRVYFHTTGGLALSLANRSVDIDFSYTNDLYAISLTGRIDEFSKEYERRVEVAGDIRLQQATTASGILTVTAANDLPSDLLMEITFPEISRGDEKLSLSLAVAQQANVNQRIDVSGWQIEPQDDSLTASIVATVPSSGDGFVTIDSSHSLHIEFLFDQLQLGSAVGIVAPTAIDWRGEQFNVDVPSGFETATLDQVDLQLTVTNSSELSGDVEIELRASNGKSVTVTGSVTAGSAISPSTSMIHSEQLADLLTPIPQFIIVDGTALLGDGVTTVHVSSDDYLSGKACISAPMALRLDAANIEGDRNRLDVDVDIADRAERLEQGIFRSTITNHLPLGAEVSVYIATDSASLFTQPLTTIGPIGFDEAPVNSGGIVTEAVVCNNTINLTKANLDVFRNRLLYVATLVTIPGTAGQTVRIRANDYLEISGIVEITARVGGEGF